MAIETLDDVIEELMDVAGIYGAHDDDESPWGDQETCLGMDLRKMCRVCATSGLRDRIIRAIEIEAKS